jgi:hypothetical protein
MSNLTSNTAFFSGETLIKVYDCVLKQEKSVQAKYVYRVRHLLYESTKRKYVYIKHVVVNGPITKYCLIKKGSIDQVKVKPSKDLYITGGHLVIINGVVMKARDVPGAEIITTKQQMIYTFVTEDHVVVSANGVDIVTFGLSEWENYQAKTQIKWHENGEDGLIN